MIVFKNIHIQNYKSIRDITLVFSKGLWEVVGYNLDSEFTSNGAGKSTLFEAIYQGLFNQSIKGINIDDTYPSGTALKSKITIELVKNDTTNFTIINDRSTPSITILKEGKDLCLKSIPSALQYIQVILGMDLQTFVATTYVSRDTLVYLLDTLSNKSLLDTLLQFNYILQQQNLFKKYSTKHRTELRNLDEKLSIADNSLKVIGVYNHIDLEPILDEIIITTNRLNSLRNEFMETSTITRSDLSTVQEKLAVYKDTEARLTSLLSLQECPTCYNSIQDTKISDILIETEKQINACNNQRLALQNSLILKENVFRPKEKELEQQLQELTNKKIEAEYNNRKYKDNRESIEELKKTIKELEDKRSKANNILSVSSTVVDLIKSGVIQEKIGSSFIATLQGYTDELLPHTGLNYIDVKISFKKNALNILCYDNRFNKHIRVNQLSNGEKARVEIVLLLAIIKTANSNTGTGCNILIFDEALDVLDTSATDTLSSLFTYLISTEDKWIGFVSHGEQLSAIPFNGKYIVQKENNVTTINETKF